MTARYSSYIYVIIVIGFAAVTMLPLSGMLLLGSASAKTTTVCPDGCDYASIQKAVDDASQGDIINVTSSTYNETVNVTKQLTLEGIDNGRGKPVIDAKQRGSAITLSANGIILKGFQLKNSYVFSSTHQYH